VQVATIENKVKRPREEFLSKKYLPSFVTLDERLANGVMLTILACRVARM